MSTLHATLINTLKHLGLSLAPHQGEDLTVTSPIDGTILASLTCDTPKTVTEKIAASVAAFEEWRFVPAPRRGELIRQFGHRLRDHKEHLATLVTLECGKILEEGRGEVQEMIDMCDFAVGLSRQIGGLTLPSERPDHVMHENWHPLGPVGIITAFNFPVAVWAWNAALALICGNPVIWKPSHSTPLCALACHHLLLATIRDCSFSVPAGLSALVIGHADIGALLVQDPAVPLISATGSTKMGRQVGEIVAKRFGRVLLELGGNNAAIVTPSANLSIAIPSMVFGAVGTAGQRCTSLRRAFIHRSRYEEVSHALIHAYETLLPHIGHPLDPSTHIGPLLNKHAYEMMQTALGRAKEQGGTIIGGGRLLTEHYPDAYYVHPALVQCTSQLPIIDHETFAPILYLIPYNTLDEAMQMHNAVPQGLSSTIFTTDLSEAEYFKRLSDCGIANVNISTSGAEIGGAFGGEKETGGGRESGSDSWKAYMRRQTSTTYFGHTPPQLAQGIVFDIPTP